MNINASLVEASSEIAALAAECGIDWYQVSNLNLGINKHPPVIDKRYKGKCSFWVEESGERTRITFHTHKHGGLSRVWSSDRKQAGLRLLTRNNSTNEQRERERRKAIYQGYQNAFNRASRVESFAYLERKGIADIVKYFDLRITSDSAAMNGRGPIKYFICYPLHNVNGTYVGLQRIYADGAKKLTSSLAEGQYKGAFAVIGDLAASETVYVAEGFATAASIFLATGKPVVIVYSAGNIEAVCSQLTARYEDHTFIICADNDASPSGNTGVFKAFEAAKKLGLSVLVPPTLGQADFNDWHLDAGLHELRHFFDTEKPQRPKAKQCDHLLFLLQYAHRQQIPDLVKRLAVVSKVPHYISGDDLAKSVKQVLGNRYDAGSVVKAIRSVIAASTFRAREISDISAKSVDKKLSFETELSPEGHSVISDSAVFAMLSELDEGALVILKSPMGTGKTERAIKLAINSANRAAHILPRISVCDDAATRLNIEHYKHVDNIVALYTNKMVSCVNSMGADRFSKDQVSWFENLDVLCLDEASQILPQITQLGRAQRRKANYESMCKAIRTAHCVLVADADANEYLVEELRKINPERKIVLIDVKHNVSVNKRWGINFTDNTKLNIEHIIRSAAQGERCLVATDNRTRALEIEEAIRTIQPNASILNVHREPTAEAKERIDRFYKDPNAEVVQYDVLIYSPAITSGVSITVQHFQKHFGVFTGIVKANDIFQMLGRDRTAREWLLSVTSRKVNRMIFDASAGMEAIGEKLTPFGALKFANDDYEEKARDNLDVLILTMLKLKGHTVNIISSGKDDLNKELGAVMKHVSEQIYSRRLDTILSQPDITEGEFLAICQKCFPTAEDAAAISAYRIRHQLGMDLTEESVKFLDRGGMQKVRLLETVMASEEAVARFDQEQKQTHDPALRYYAGEKRAMIIEAIKLLKIDTPTFKGEFRQRDCEKVVEFFLQNALKANILFDRIIDPRNPPKGATRFVMKLFARLGFKVGKRKSHGNMVRFLDAESVAQMLSILDRRKSLNQNELQQQGEDTSRVA
jgi:phage/plasmid primase-like uncharacterized protein